MALSGGPATSRSAGVNSASLGRRAKRLGARDLGFPRGSLDGARISRIPKARQQGESGFYFFDPGPSVSRRHGWIVDARRKGQLGRLIVQGPMTERRMSRTRSAVHPGRRRGVCHQMTSSVGARVIARGRRQEDCRSSSLGLARAPISMSAARKWRGAGHKSQRNDPYAGLTKLAFRATRGRSELAAGVDHQNGEWDFMFQVCRREVLRQRSDVILGIHQCGLVFRELLSLRHSSMFCFLSPCVLRSSR